MVTLTNTELQDQVQSRGKAMLYVLFHYRRWERGLNTRTGPFPEYDAGGDCNCPSIKYGNGATMAIWAALEKLSFRSPNRDRAGPACENGVNVDKA